MTLEMSLEKINELAVDNATQEKLMEELKKIIISLGMKNECRYYILIVACSLSRGI